MDLQAMKRHAVAWYGRELVQSHRAPSLPEVRHADGYEQRIPDTEEGIEQSRKRAALWLAFHHRARR